MIQLKNLLRNLQTESVVGNIDIQVNEIQMDSRKVRENDLFFAINGTLVDGHKFIGNVISAGATVIVCETLPTDVPKHITFVVVTNSSYATGIIAANYFDNPSEKLRLVGVTGTNGKTSTVRLLHQLFRKLGISSGLLSTINNKINEDIQPSTHTTPDPIQLNRLLRKMVEAGCQYCFMEVSSHAVHQHRIAGLAFTGGVFTNITHDHLDYHGTFEEYKRIKKSYLSSLSESCFVVTNIDDPFGEEMVNESKARVVTISLKKKADYFLKIIKSDINDLIIELDTRSIRLNLKGTFNAYNILSVLSVAESLGIKREKIIPILSELEPIPGRFDYIKSKKDIIGIVDFAHTPDALINILENIKGLNPSRIITVIGCGGDRDREKRPIMGSIAESYSDTVILTSDNSRSEDPNHIISEMKAGMQLSKQTTVILDRHEAIQHAVSIAKSGDVILLAGKGHETYQEVQGVKHHFDDKEILMTYLNEN